MSLSLRLCVLIVGGFLCAMAAHAQGLTDAAAAWGLLGTWAPDCTKPASRENGYLTFARADAVVTQRRDFGDLRDEHLVTAARILPDGQIEVVMDFESLSTERTIVLAKEGDGKMRAVSNRDEKGDYTIKAGKFTANGEDSPWQYRCNAPM